MAERPLYTLYKNLKAQNYDVPNDYNKFESALTRDGKSGADNRHAIYENLKAQNFDVPDTYERFYTALFEPRSKTSSRAKGGSVPMSAADRARFSAGAAAISASAKQIANNAGRYNRLKQRKQKQQKDFGRVNLGTHLTPFGGDANDVVKDEFAYNPETGKAGAYVTSDNEIAYTQSDAEQRQAILDKYGEEWNKAVDMGMVPSELDKADPGLSDTDVAMRQMERRQEWLDENQNRRSQELNESMHLQDSPFVASGGAVAPSSFNAAIGNEANRLSDAEYGAYNTAKAYNQMLRTTLLQELKEQKQRNEDAGWWKDKWNDVSNYFGAMFNTMIDPKLYSQGVMDAAIASNLLQVKKGMEDGTIKKGSNAGEAAQVMLSAIQQQQGESAKQQQYGAKAYQYGDVSGRSLKFMADFALSGWRNVMTTGFTKAGEKVGEKMALGTLGKWFTKNTGRVLGDMAGSAALAATNQLGSTYNNVIERYVGMNNENGGVTQDKDGDLKFNEGVSLGKAIKDGFGSATIENFSEMFGEYLPGASKILSKLGLSKVSSFFEKIGNNAYYKWLSNATNKSGIQGVMSEIAEEEFGTALHAAWGDGDGSWSDFNVFTNPDAREKQIDTCLGMFYSVGFMQSPRTAVGAINAVKYFHIKLQVTKADKFGQMMFNDKWDDIKSKIDVTTNADLTKMVLDATRSDSMTAKQKGAVINYAMFLSKLRGFNQASDAKTKDKVEEGETTPTLSNDLDDAYTEGHNADDADKHNIQIQHEDQAKTLAAALNISEQQLSGMSDEELESLTGQDDKLDQAIYDYQLSSARYQGVVDDAQDKVDLAAHQAEQRVNMYTDQSRGSVRNATIKASGGAEDYGVYIISGNIATHDDGSIDVSNSDDMILYFDPTTNSVEHADALMFAELGEELPADEVKAQAVADAKENAIKEVAGIIDGTVDVGSQFLVTDADGTEHTYEVLADNGDGTAMITIDGNVPTELVKGENVQIPYSFEDLQKMKDLEDQNRLEAAKAEREQMEKERDGQETEQTEESQPSFDFNQILNDNGNVVLVDVLGKDGNTKYPGSTLFLIRDAGAKAKVVELKSDGTLVPHAVNKEDVRATQPMSLDEYKQAFASSMIEDNSGENRGEIEEETPTIEGETAGPAEENAAPESAETTATEQTPVITLEDGTIVPMLEDGNPDFSKLSAAQTAELYDTQFDEDADGIVSGYVSDAKKALDKANNMTVKGKTFVEQKAAKAAKEKAIADAQAAYDSAVAIRDAYNERQLAKEENTPEGRKSLIEKAKRKYTRLKNSEEWSERPGDLWNETVGKLLHRLYDATGIDVFNDTPNTVYEYVAENVGPYSLNYEGNDNSKGVQQETGLSRSDFAKLGWLAAEGKGMTIDAKVHRLWENRPSNLESADTQEIRNALISLITSGQTAFQARDYILNQRIELAESALEEQLRQEEDAAEAQKAKEEEEKKKAEEEKTNENRNAPELSHEQQKAKEEGEKLGFPAVDKEGEPINQNVIELANWAKEQGLEIDPTSKLNSYADLYVMCKGGFGVSMLVPDVGEDINQVFYFPDNVQGEQLAKLQEEFNVGRDLKHSADMNSELTEGAMFYDGDTAREFKEFVDKKVEMQNKVFGEQRPEEDLPFSTKDNGQQQTTSERAADVEKNKVDDMKVVDNIVGQKTRKTLEKLAKMMGANVQWQYSDKNANGWFDDKTNTIYLTLDSSITEGVQFIFGHEMTHEMRTKNPAAYDELKTLVKDMMGEDAFNSETDRITSLYNENNVFYNGGRTAYEEEVVADQLGKWIRDANYAHTLLLKMSHPLLAKLHEIVNRFLMALHGIEISDDMNLILRSIEQAYVKTAKGEVTNSETGEDVSFSLRQKPEPKKKGVGYKVFVLKDGKLYPPMVANSDGAATPVGVWLDADAAPIAGESKTGRPQVKQGGKGTQGGSGKLAYRPGWHLGVVPYAIQFNRKDAEGNKTLFPKNFVFAEVEYAADVDYQEEARQEGINPSGKYQHSLAGLKHLPTDGYYMYRTNPNPETDPWVITGAMKVNRILTRAEQAKLVKNAGREPQQIQEGDIVTDDVVNSINQEIADAPKFSLKVYHGSGADFTEFDFDHMGEGAGSQAFGWGGYVTSSEKIGKSYAKITQQKPTYIYNGKEMSEDDFQEEILPKIGSQNENMFMDFLYNLEKYGVSKAKNILRKGDYGYYKNLLKGTSGDTSTYYEGRVKAAEVLLALHNIRIKKQKTNLYEVDIPEDNGSNYLEWEGKIPDSLDVERLAQSTFNESASDMYKGASNNYLDKVKEDIKAKLNRCDTVKDLYDVLRFYTNSAAASKMLSDLGFVGIKYPAGTILGGAEEGDTNYVIFKPEDMKITEHTKFSLRLKSAIEETETNPSDAQKESGNYKKGHIKFGGYDYTIENPKGSTRSGKDANGKEWKVTMHDTYGYIRGKFGKDGDHLDMFINDKADLDNWNGDVFVVDQVNPDGSFDEHKVMYGYDSMDDAEKAYLANYSTGWKGLGNITGASKAEFDKWLDTSNRKIKPFADYAKIKFSQAQSVDNEEPKTFEEFLNHLSLKFSIKNEEQRKAAEDAYEYAAKLRPNKYAQYAIVDMGMPSKVPEYYEKKVLADNWRRFYNRAVHNELNDVRKKAWGNYKLFDLDRPFADQVNEVKGYVPDEFDAPDAATNKDNIKGLDRQMSSVAETRYSLKDIKPVGVGAFGNIYNQFRGKSKAAIEFLKKLGSGEATAALHHHTIGDISLVWGDKKAGLDKILRKHPEVVDNLQSIIDSMEVVQESDNRVKLESPTHFAVVSKEYKGEPREQWLLTAYEKRESLENDKSMDTATSSLGGDTALSQSKGSAAKIDNSSETAKENGEKFSLKDEKTLAGVHNITEEKLRKALKLGGFANPSLAVIDTNKSGHNNFGEISFIAPSALLDKRTGKTAGTWITDAYTQRYPSVEREMSEKGYRKFEDWVDSLDYPSGAKAEIERQAKDALSDNNAPAWELMYLKEKGIDIKAYDSNVDYRWKEIISDHPTAEDILNSMKTDPELNENVTSLAKHVIIYPTWEKVSLEVRRKIYKETGVKKSPISPIVRQQTKEIFERDYKSTLLNKDGSPRKKDVKKVVEDIVKEHNDTKKYDFYLSKVKASGYVNKNGLYDDYIRWQEKKLDEFGTKNRIFRGYKPDGTRKYVPETLENVSKVMREKADGQTNGSEYTSFGSFIAKVASRVDSTDEMRANKNKLSSNEDKEEFYEKWSEVYYDLAKFLYNDVFYGEQRLHDIVLQSDPKKYAKKEYGITLTPTFMKKLDALKNAVQTELKSAYFETKYNRPLRLNEFAAAVVPDNLGEDVRKGIEDAGLPMYNYDPNKEGDRNRAFNEAVNSSDNIRFSLKEEKEKIVADAKANGTYMTAPNGEKTKLDAEQWATVRTTNFKNWFGDWENDPENASKVVDENGEPMVVYHGTTNDETIKVWNEKAKTYDTSHEPFTLFKRAVDGLPNSGMFFNSSENNAYEYGYNHYAVYLNAKNPLVIDCKGNLYNSIKHEGKTMDTYDWANWAEENGFDGVIFKNIKDGVDYGSMQNTTDDYVVFYSNQIKSSENNNGDFSADNNDIRFSLRNLDQEYLDAVKKGDMEKAQRLVNKAAAVAGYSTDSSYQGTSAFNGSAPWGNGYFLTKEERKEAWNNGEFEGESTLGDYINDDIDGGNLEALTNTASYRASDPMRKEAIDNVRNAIQKKSKFITMYRSVPSDVKEGTFRNGDWITPSRSYAVDNAKLHGWGNDYNIIEQKVPVDDVWFDGNDIAEWGYGIEKDYINDTDFAYKNVKNNRKLLDVVTYNDNGEVIPLSQRFDPSKSDTRFSLRYDQFEHDLNQWKKDNNLPKDAKRPTIPQRNAGESAVDFLRRVDEYRKQMALWKTAPTYEQHLLSDDTALGEFNRELQRGSVLKRIAFQDSMLAIRKAQEAIMKEVGVDRLNMAEDAYTAENRSHGKGKNEFEEYNNEFLQPLRKAYHQMKKVLGDSYDNVRLYMMAKHGLERNAQMAFKKSLEADYEDVAQRSAAYKAYKGDISRIGNDSGFELGLIDYATWVRTDNAIKMKYSPSYMKYRYDKMGIAFDYSGLSALFDGSDFEEAAHKLVRDIESKHIVETKELWDATNAATKKILRDGYKAGMMSEDTYQYVRDMYSHYIPLRGWDGTTADQVWDYVGGGNGALNQTLKKAHGRTSIADDPIAYIENMAESGILLNNKNWVKQHLMLLAQNHPTSLLTLSKAWYVKSADANGNEEWIPATPQITSQMNSNQVKAAIDAFEQKMENMAQTGDATQQREGLNIAYPQTHSEEREHEVRVMKDGEEYVIYVNGDPQLAQAMNNTRAHRVREIQSGKLDRAAAWLGRKMTAAWLGRKMAAAYTSLSPLFIPSNYFRDLTMTLASTAIREDGRYNYLLRKNLATSWNLGFMLKDYQSGKLREKVSNGNATPKEQMFYDFMMNGGETGFVSSLDVEDLKKKFKNDLKDLNRWKANPVRVGHTIMDSIEFLNRAIEDSNRFAIYMTSIQYGRSIDEAVNDAKDVTLNFNRKGTGEYGWQMIRNLYLFINPAVQSLQTLGALVKHHPFKFTAVTASWLASGVLVPIVNAALMSLLGGDDDKDKYWQFTKWDRRNNLIMWVPFTHEYVKIPLAQEFRAFYGVGDMIASKMMGGELAEESWSQYAEDLLGQVVDMLPLDPTGYDGNIAVSLMPNVIRPVFELAFNVDFTGKPLFKDTEYNKYDPNFTKAYVGTPDWLVRASKMVNSIGNDYPDVQQNSIDAFGDPRYNLNNPGVVDHVLSSYLGGAYTMGSQVLGVLTKLLNDPKEIKVADIPLFSKFVSNPDDRPVTKKQGDEFWDMKENHDRAANTLSKLKKQAKVDGDYSMLERFYGSEEYRQYKQDDVKVKKYEEDKKKERAEESGEEYRPHKLNAEDIYKAHATPKDDFEDLKLKQLYTKLNGFKSTYDLLVDTAPSQSDGYYNANKTAIDAIDEISLDKQEISELKKGFLDDGKDAYNAEDMKRIRELRKKVLAVLEKANKVVVANQKTKKK
jgi:hypothetical protein